jgi:hypothetical protein
MLGERGGNGNGQDRESANAILDVVLKQVEKREELHSPAVEPTRIIYARQHLGYQGSTVRSRRTRVSGAVHPD